MGNMQGTKTSEGLSIRQLAPLFSKRRDRLRGLTQRVLACWACFTPRSRGYKESEVRTERGEKGARGVRTLPCPLMS